MKYISVKEAAKRWGVSERSVRDYCARGRIEGAFLTGKTWAVPEDAEKPTRALYSRSNSFLLPRLKSEKKLQLRGGIYHRLQVDMTYNSNHIEGSRLTQDETRLIFETNTIGANGSLLVDDIVETANHFRCVDLVIDNATHLLSEEFIKKLHLTLKNGTSDSRLTWFAVGNYKKIPNEVGGSDTVLPADVAPAMKSLLAEYNSEKEKSFDDILDFHYRFEKIHPFQDGNGRVGRLILLKECLKNGIVPFIISDKMKNFYYRGLQMWQSERGYLRDTCLAAQDDFKKQLDYFKIKYH